MTSFPKLSVVLLGTALLAAPQLASAQHLASVSFSPSSLQGGNSTQCTVKLTAAGNATPITISNPYAFIQTPALVTVPQGSQSFTFSVTTSSVSANKAATLAFSDGTVTQRPNLLVLAAVQPSTVSVAPNSLKGGDSAVGTVHLTNPAPGGGFTVQLSSSQSFVQVPATVDVTSGNQDATFAITTSSVSALKAATISASGNGVTVQAGVQVVQTPSAQSVTFASPKVIGRSFVTGTVTLDAYAPPGDTVVQLSSDQSCAQVPTSVTVTHGHNAAKFTISTTNVTDVTTAHIGAQVQGAGSPVSSAVDVVPPGLANSAWPKFRQNTFNTGLGLGSGADGTLKWSFTRSTNVITDPVIGEDGTIYVAAHGLSALNPNGTEKWHCETGVGGAPIIGADGTIYQSTTTSIVAVYPSGTIKWRATTEDDLGPGAAAMGADGTVYAVQGHHLYAVNPDGTLQWTYATDGRNFRSSVAVAPDGTIYFNYTNEGFYAVNPDGTEKWLYLIVGLSLGAPTIAADGTLYACGSDGTVCAVTTEGHTKWIANVGWFATSPSVAPDGTIYVGSMDKSLYAINGTDGTIKWSFKTGDGVFGNSVVDAAGTIYFGSDDASFYALNPNGTLRWSFQTGGKASGNPAIDSDGTIYFTSKDLKLYAIGASGPHGVSGGKSPK